MTYIKCAHMHSLLLFFHSFFCNSLPLSLSLFHSLCFPLILIATLFLRAAFTFYVIQVYLFNYYFVFFTFNLMFIY